ncbi:MAG: YfhO family protein, partial [Saprospiraceae bacterium]|nr:YfhO family protein [Saprospiraceae bacterium]
PAALGNSWFVNNIIYVNDDNAEIDSLTTFDPSGDVIINKQFQEYVGNLNPSKNGSIDLISYSPNKLEYKSNTKGEQLAVFSEVYYGPNKGWQAYLDGQPVDHIRVDYLLRGLKVPDGEHTIIFEFKPKAYFAGEKVSLVSSLILLLLLGYVIYSQAVKIKNKENE